MASVLRSAYAVEAERIGDDRIPGLSATTEDVVASPLIWWLAVDGDDVHGALAVDVEAGADGRPCHEIDSLVVRPASHRRGIGTALLAHALADAAQDDAEVAVSTGRDNRPALALYTRFGFRVMADTEVVEGLWIRHLAWRQRRAVRIVCLDEQENVLLLRWQDPADGHAVLEPPGGGMEEGETTAGAAVRELAEETGFIASPAELGDPVAIARDQWWNGQRRVASERFFLLRVTGTAPAIDQVGLMDDERATAQGHCWVLLGQLAGLADVLQPPDLAGIVETLVGRDAGNA